MTGGVIFQRIQPDMNLTVDAIRSRIAPGASVDIYALDEHDVRDVQELMDIYINTLEENRQADSVQHLYNLKSRPQDYFIRISPLRHERNNNLPPRSPAPDLRRHVTFVVIWCRQLQGEAGHHGTQVVSFVR